MKYATIQQRPSDQAYTVGSKMGARRSLGQFHVHPCLILSQEFLWFFVSFSWNWWEICIEYNQRWQYGKEMCARLLLRTCDELETELLFFFLCALTHIHIVYITHNHSYFCDFIFFPVSSKLCIYNSINLFYVVELIHSSSKINQYPL